MTSCTLLTSLARLSSKGFSTESASSFRTSRLAFLALSNVEWIYRTFFS